MFLFTFIPTTIKPCSYLSAVTALDSFDILVRIIAL